MEFNQTNRNAGDVVTITGALTDKFFVWWSAGKCNDGSCDQGMREFKTLTEAEQFIAEIRPTLDEPIIRMIRGSEVKSVKIS